MAWLKAPGIYELAGPDVGVLLQRNIKLLPAKLVLRLGHKSCRIKNHLWNIEYSMIFLSHAQFSADCLKKGFNPKCDCVCLEMQGGCTKNWRGKLFHAGFVEGLEVVW